MLTARPQRKRAIAFAVRVRAGSMVLIYLLTQLPDPLGTSGGGDGRIYGIKTVRLSAWHRPIVKGASAEDISRKRDEAKRLFHLISRNTVTPLLLHETLSDIMGTELL